MGEVDGSVGGEKGGREALGCSDGVWLKSSVLPVGGVG